MTDNEYEIIKLQRDAAMQEADELYQELQRVKHHYYQYKKEMEKKLRSRRGRRSKQKRHQLDT